MPPKGKSSKSIWRSADAQHFTLVHRSQRDPLINDPDAPSRVLAPTQRKQQPGGNAVTRRELEEEFKTRERANVGEAAAYGVYFDDTEYDYMQHLRPIGGGYNAARGGKDEEVDVDVVMLPGPEGTKGKEKERAKERERARQQAGGLEFKDDQQQQASHTAPDLALPKDVFASRYEMDRDWARDSEEQKGLRLDMDPHLRQTLEALDDEAFLVGKAKAAAAKRRQAAEEQAEKEAQEQAADDDGDGDDDDDDDDDDDEFGQGDEDDFDALFQEVIAGGEYDADYDAADEWRKLAPEGDEALYLSAAEKAQRKLAASGSGSGAPNIDDPELSLSERVALFKQGLAAGAGAGAGADDAGPPAGLLRGDKASGSQQARAQSRRAPSSVGGSSIFGEGAPGRKSKPGAKARHAMSFYAPSAGGGSTAWSMSSSAMERNSGLKGLDEQFDRMEQIYEQDDEEGGDDDGYGDDFPSDDDDDDDDGEGEGEGYVREDFESILDEFLEKHEVIAGKMKQRLGTADATPAEKLDIVRKEVGSARLSQWLEEREETQEEIDRDIEGRIRVVGLKRDEWDVQTIQTTKTNMTNHPRVLSSVGSTKSSIRPGTLASSSSRGSIASGSGSSAGGGGGGGEFERRPIVRVNRRTGAAEVVGWTKQQVRRRRRGGGGGEGGEEGEGEGAEAADDDDDDDDDDAVLPDLSSLSVSIESGGPTPLPPDDDAASSAGSGSDSDASTATATATESTLASRGTLARPKHGREPKEAKRARKAAAKLEKQVRKIEKASRRAEFAGERKRQAKVEAGRVKEGGAADVRVGAGRRLA